MAHLCYSGHSDCSGARPCTACYGLIQSVVLPRAMFIAGEPFSSNSNLAMLFMRSFQQAFRESVGATEEQFRAAEAVQAAARTVAGQAPTQEEQEPPVRGPSIDEFKGAIIDQIQQMSDAKYAETALKLHNGRFAGWEALNPEEQFVLLELFQPPQGPLGPIPMDEEAPTEEGAADGEEGGGDPMSAENAAKVVAAIRNGTLSPETVATPPQEIVEPPDGSSQAPGPQARLQSSEGQSTGTENSASTVESEQESTST